MSLYRKSWTLCHNLNEPRDKRMRERKNNGLHHPKGRTDGKWNDDVPSSLLFSHSAISVTALCIGYPSDCISSGQISSFTLHPLLPPPLLRRPTSVQWQGLLRLLEERGREVELQERKGAHRQSDGCTEWRWRDKPSKTQTKNIFILNLTPLTLTQIHTKKLLYVIKKEIAGSPGVLFRSSAVRCRGSVT